MQKTKKRCIQILTVFAMLCMSLSVLIWPILSTVFDICPQISWLIEYILIGCFLTSGITGGVLSLVYSHEIIYGKDEFYSFSEDCAKALANRVLNYFADKRDWRSYQFQYDGNQYLYQSNQDFTVFFIIVGNHHDDDIEKGYKYIRNNITGSRPKNVPTSIVCFVCVDHEENPYDLLTLNLQYPRYANLCMIVDCSKRQVRYHCLKDGPYIRQQHRLIRKMLRVLRETEK